jgi:hypothetical protein
MNNTEKKLDALIAAMGFDVEVTKDYKKHEVSKTQGEAFILNKTVGLNPVSHCGEYLRTADNGYIMALTDPVIDYKLTKRNINSEPLNCHVACVPLPVQSDAWGGVVNYCASHVDDIEAGVGDFDMLRPIWEFMKGKGNE